LPGRMVDSGNIDKEELKKLSPEARIKKLKELEDKGKKELEETDKLIRESFEEIERREILDEPPEEEEPARSIFEEESQLEQQVIEEEPTEIQDGQQNIEYAINLYTELTGMAEEMAAANDGYMNMNRAAEIYDKIKETEKYQSQDQTAKNIAEGSRRLMRELFGDYKADLEYRPDQ